MGLGGPGSCKGYIEGNWIWEWNCSWTSIGLLGLLVEAMKVPRFYIEKLFFFFFSFVALNWYFIA